MHNYLGKGGFRFFKMYLCQIRCHSVTKKLHFLINNIFYRLLKFGHNFLQYFAIAAKRKKMHVSNKDHMADIITNSTEARDLISCSTMVLLRQFTNSPIVSGVFPMRIRSETWLSLNCVCYSKFCGYPKECPPKTRWSISCVFHKFADLIIK